MHSLESYTPEVMNPTGFIAYNKILNTYAQEGGNYFRMLVAPWNLEIEFEKLGDYTNRMQCAWELDIVLNTVDSLGLLVHFNLQVHYPLELNSVYRMFNWDFTDIPCFDNDEPYCYHTALELDTPLDFLKSDEARKHYQNRLRYYIARYGDHPAIGAIELLSEINNIGQDLPMDENCENTNVAKIQPYYTEDGFARSVYEWQANMLGFIKDELNYREHLLAVSYTGIPEYVLGDSSYYIPQLDIATYNDYTSSINQFRNLSKTMARFQSKGKSPYSNENPPAINKPLMLSEIGPGSGIEQCDDQMRFVKSVWMTAFSGLSGSAMNWSYQRDPTSWNHLQRVDSIMSGINLEEGKWRAVNDLSNNKWFDLVALTQSGVSRQALGVIHNRTFNFYTTSDDPNSSCKTFVTENPQFFPSELLSTQQDFGTSRPSKLTLPNMGAMRTYVIEFFDVETGELVYSTTHNTGLDAKLPIHFQKFFDAKHSIFFFKVTPKKLWKDKNNN
ncbi:MAG: hypothetical protein HRT74_03955 [Flavobacteriales bacterium]|nr:hypothetical protein [Flavobacteriales bacterium]